MAARGRPLHPGQPTRPRVAVVATVCQAHTHADIILGKLLDGHHFDGQFHPPSLQVARCFVAQRPADDLSAALTAAHGIDLVDSIRTAILGKGVLGEGDDPVDGVLLIGEHGDYPSNERGQKLYPRREFFAEIAAACQTAGRALPVFIDKHLSYDWQQATWMTARAASLGMPLMAGSSLPVTWRLPPLELELGTGLEHAVVASFGHKESYGFHALESLQCMVERRDGGETGVGAVQYLEGDAVWGWTDRHSWPAELLDSALEQSVRAAAGPVRDVSRMPALFVVEYGDGFTAAVYLLSGALMSTSIAARLRDGTVAATRFHRQERPWGQFSALVHHVERFVATGVAPYPVARTLLTTGVLASLMESSVTAAGNRGTGDRIETPHLDVSYEPSAASVYHRGPVDAEELGADQ